jgi:hypothetical protein
MRIYVLSSLEKLFLSDKFEESIKLPELDNNLLGRVEEKPERVHEIAN